MYKINKQELEEFFNKYTNWEVQIPSIKFVKDLLNIDNNFLYIEIKKGYHKTTINLSKNYHEIDRNFFKRDENFKYANEKDGAIYLKLKEIFDNLNI